MSSICFMAASFTGLAWVAGFFGASAAITVAAQARHRATDNTRNIRRKPPEQFGPRGAGRTSGRRSQLPTVLEERRAHYHPGVGPREHPDRARFRRYERPGRTPIRRVLPARPPGRASRPAVTPRRFGAARPRTRKTLSRFRVASAGSRALWRDDCHVV